MDNLSNEATELFGEMRNATKKEQECVKNIISEMSTETGVDFWDLIDTKGGSMRRIDADTFKESLIKVRGIERNSFIKILEVIDNTPTVEEVTGEWIEVKTVSKKCSVCRCANHIHNIYCGICGSKNTEVD